jgi:hypothetical protein
MASNFRSARARRVTLLLGALALCLAAAAPAMAGSYQGYGDTGWTHDNKRDCCDDAGWLAQDDSAYRCESAGGHPKITSGTIRAVCDWDARGAGRDRIYRCTASTTVHCR